MFDSKLVQRGIESGVFLLNAHSVITRYQPLSQRGRNIAYYIKYPLHNGDPYPACNADGNDDMHVTDYNTSCLF